MNLAGVVDDVVIRHDVALATDDEPRAERRPRLRTGFAEATPKQLTEGQIVGHAAGLVFDHLFCEDRDHRRYFSAHDGGKVGWNRRLLGKNRRCPRRERAHRESARKQGAE